MQFVEPIRDAKKIAQIRNTLRGNKNFRDLVLFQLGINSALRISDLLRTRVCDLFEDDKSIKESFKLKESKTSKTNRITITPKVKEALTEYKEAYPKVIEDKNNFIFFHSKFSPIGKCPIGRKQAWVLISRWCKESGLKGEFGGHTLRKTWGYHARLKSIPLEIIQHKLNHSSIAITQRYLGITAQEIEDACNKLDL